MNGLTKINLPSRARSQKTRETLAIKGYDIAESLAMHEIQIELLSRTPFRTIGQKLAKGESLSFDEAFIGMMYVVSATNRKVYQNLQTKFSEANGVKIKQSDLLGPAQTFLTAMAQRSQTLIEVEIAGMVAAVLSDIVLRFNFAPEILEIGGMGGDKGIVINGKKHKVINASTLSAIILSSLGVSVLKHGGHANTSAVGATETIETLNVNIYQDDLKQILKMHKEVNFYYSDTHATKTIHDLTHSPLLRYETITHLLGPMTVPVHKSTRLFKVLGINESVEPATVAKSYQMIHQAGYQKIGNVIIVAGLGPDAPADLNAYDYGAFKRYIVLDEVSPYKTVLSIVRNGKYVGNVIVTPEDFGVKLKPAEILCENDGSRVRRLNLIALSKTGRRLHEYLALNSAVGLMCVRHVSKKDFIINEKINPIYAKEAMQICMEALKSGAAEEQLHKIRKSSRSSDMECL